MTEARSEAEYNEQVAALEAEIEAVRAEIRKTRTEKEALMRERDTLCVRNCGVPASILITTSR